ALVRCPLSGAELRGLLVRDEVEVGDVVDQAYHAAWRREGVTLRVHGDDIRLARAEAVEREVAERTSGDNDRLHERIARDHDRGVANAAAVSRGHASRNGRRRRRRAEQLEAPAA